MALETSHLETFRQLCALVLPAWEQMPCAADLDLSEQLETVLRVRPGLEVPLIAALEQFGSPLDESQLLAMQIESPQRVRLLTSVVCGAYYQHEDVRTLLGYDGQQALTLSRGGFGAEELVLELMEQPKRYRDPDDSRHN